MEIEVVATATAISRSLPVEKTRTPNPYAAFELASVLVLLGDFGAAFPIISADDLAAMAPPGTVVARASDVPPSVLAACCPDVLFKIGPSSAMTARSPRTRVVLAAESGTIDPAPEDVDVLWQIQSPEDLTAANLAALLAEIGDRA
jgi:hypothetical protein